MLRPLKARFDRVWGEFSPDYAFFNVLAVLTGIGAGLAAIGLNYLIIFMRWLFIADGNVMDMGLPIYVVGAIVILAPAIGGLLVGLIIKFIAKEARGGGVQEVMESMAVNGGRIRPRVVLVKTISTAITIGSGGASGKEGPIVLIGSALGSSLGQALGLNPYQTKVLVACGSAGGISAIFNTPIAAVFFPIELILGEFKTRSFIPIVIASVFANITRRVVLAMIGSDEKFVFGADEGAIARAFELASIWEFGLYIVLGVTAAIVAAIFIKTLYTTQEVFHKLKVPMLIKPALGGLFVGLIGFMFLAFTGESTYVFGIGYHHIIGFMDGDWANHSFTYLILLLGALVIFKIFATSLSLGSGASGGVFAPSLYIGGMLGGAFGVVANKFAPFATADPASYVLVGMAAVFAGASRATITAMLIMFEMTGSYDIILPLMLACVISDGIGAFLLKDNIYTMQLRNKGLRQSEQMAADVLELHEVGYVMEKNPLTVHDSMALNTFEGVIMGSRFNNFPVVSHDGRLLGIASRSALEEWRRSKRNHSVRNIMTTDFVAVYPTDPLKDAVGLMGQSGQSILPVIDPQAEERLLGVVSGKDVIEAYRKHMEENVEQPGLVRSLMRLGKKK